MAMRKTARPLQQRQAEQLCVVVCPQAGLSPVIAQFKQVVRDPIAKLSVRHWSVRIDARLEGFQRVQCESPGEHFRYERCLCLVRNLECINIAEMKGVSLKRPSTTFSVDRTSQNRSSTRL